MVETEYGSNNYYKMIKEVSGYKPKNNFLAFPGKTREQTFKEIHQYFDKLANIHNPLASEEMVIGDGEVDIEVEESTILCLLRNLKNKSTIAPDGIPQFILKEFAIELVKPITSLIGKSIKQCVCPNVWKITYLHPIPKVPVPLSPEQIRPISISSSLSKICEKIILNVLLGSIIDKFDDQQFGGIPKKSTCQYLTMYVDNSLKALDNHNTSVVSLITDYSKAYDNIDHNVFMRVFKLMNPPGNIVRWIASFLSNRSQIIRSLEDNYIIHNANGVPQGTVLAGLIFAITVNNVANNISGRLKYVDDLTVSAVVHNNDISNLQSMADVVIEDSKEVGLPLNINKCCLIVHDFGKNKCRPSIKMNGVLIQQKSHIKLLGLIIQEDFKWGMHIESIITSTNKSLFILYNLKKYNADQKILKDIYLKFIRPKLEYNCPIWHSSITKKQSDDLELIQKRIIKLIMGREHVNYINSLEKLRIKTLVERRVDLLDKFAIKFAKQYPSLLPKSLNQISGRITRRGGSLAIPRFKTKRYGNSPMNAIFRSLNKYQNSNLLICNMSK